MPDMQTRDELSQCLGIAKSTNQRCKLKVDQSVTLYCHYHINQSENRAPHGTQKLVKSKVSPSLTDQFNPTRYQTGHIYVYTLKHLLSPKPQKQPWLKIRRAGDDSKDPKSFKDFDPKNHILVKVGLTQGSVLKRLQQWENKCQHQLVVVEPEKSMINAKLGGKSGINEDSENKLIRFFKKLKIHEGTKEVLTHYRGNEYGFHTRRNLGLIEKQIHSSLRAQYGHGDVLCYGCKAKTAKNEYSDYGIHVEWFLIPRKDISVVFKIIDSVIQNMHQ